MTSSSRSYGSSRCLTASVSNKGTIASIALGHNGVIITHLDLSKRRHVTLVFLVLGSVGRRSLIHGFSFFVARVTHALIDRGTVPCLCCALLLRAVLAASLPRA